MLKPTVKVKGGRRLQRELDKLSKIAGQPTRVKVGVPQESGNYPDGTSLVLVAAANEFGTTDGRIPERSYLRSTLIKEERTFRTFWTKGVAKGLLEGAVSPEAALSLLGQLAEAKVKQQIVQLSEPPNAEITILAKGSSNPLIDTGQLLQSIRFQVDTDA